MKKLYIFLIVFIIGYGQLSLAQTTDEKSTPTRTSEEVESLMNQNFRDLRAIHSAILNFGKGQEDFDKLLDNYSLGFAYFMEYRLDESYKILKQNEQEILKTATDLAKIYQKDTEQIYRQTVQKFMKIKMQDTLASTKLDQGTVKSYSPVDIFMSNSANTLVLANKQLKNSNPIDAIFYFRRAKQFSFQCYEISQLSVDSRYNKHISDLQDFVYQETNEELAKKIKGN